jgi:hypothetical protein
LQEESLVVPIKDLLPHTNTLQSSICSLARARINETGQIKTRSLQRLDDPQTSMTSGDCLWGEDLALEWPNRTTPGSST